jgi:endonuclease/exonuclease/phosphatase family metal-dependent hydrolase
MVKVTLPGDQEVYFGSTHLDVTMEENRILQSGEIVSIAGKLDAPVIVGGDFNSTDDRAPITELLKYFKDASTLKEPTIPVINPRRRIDYILFAKPGDFEVLKEEVMTEDNYGSDHLAFWVRLRY